jgi:hypothetical protein
LPGEPTRTATVEPGARALEAERTVDTSANPIYPENDPRHHTAKVKKQLEDVIDNLRDNTVHFADPKAQTLFAASASVLEGLRNAFDDFEAHSDGGLGD